MKHGENVTHQKQNSILLNFFIFYYKNLNQLYVSSAKGKSVYPLKPPKNQVLVSAVWLISLFLRTLIGRSGLEIDSVPNETACAIPVLVRLIASSMDTPSFAMRFPL